MMRFAIILLALGAVLAAAPVEDLLRDAAAAEARFDSARALELYRAADEGRPNDAAILQKIARQYSDLVLEQTSDADKRRLALQALEYAERAVALQPNDAVNVLSLAVCHGKLAVYSDVRSRIASSRRVREEAERALALDPSYAWAHHILGRWHYEVASLTSAKRWIVRFFYGGLPDASVVQAIEHLERAVTLDPAELNHHLELGFAYAAAGRRGEAEAAWLRGLDLPERSKHDASAKQRSRQALALHQARGPLG